MTDSRTMAYINMYAVLGTLENLCELDDKAKEIISTLDKQYEIYEKHGITLAYHHHNWEYIKLSNGKTRMAEILSETKKIKIVHDTYWTARCGTDPVLQIKEFGNRLLGIHLRDLTFKKSGIDVLSVDTSIGNGVINFGGVLEAALENGCNYYVIEQKTDEPYADIEKSFKYLNSIITNIKE